MDDGDDGHELAGDFPMSMLTKPLTRLTGLMLLIMKPGVGVDVGVGVAAAFSRSEGDEERMPALLCVHQLPNHLASC